MVPKKIIRWTLIATFGLSAGVPLVFALERGSGAFPDFFSKPNEQLSKGMLLVAARKMPDPRFRGTVILLLEHGAKGSMGLIINRGTQIELPRVLPKIQGLEGRGDQIAYGGPVALNVVFLIVRESRPPEESALVFDDVYYSVSRVVLEQMLKQHKTAKELRVFFGHSGWASGQLEAELANGDWHLLPADTEIIFKTDPSMMWRELIQRFPFNGIQALGSELETI